MGEQLRMFRMTQGEVEIKTKQLVDCWRQIGELGRDLKKAQEALRESAEAKEVNDIRADVKSARETADKLLRELSEDAPELQVKVSADGSEEVTLTAADAVQLKRAARRLRSVGA